MTPEEQARLDKETQEFLTNKDASITLNSKEDIDHLLKTLLAMEPVDRFMEEEFNKMVFKYFRGHDERAIPVMWKIYVMGMRVPFNYAKFTRDPAALERFEAELNKSNDLTNL